MNIKEANTIICDFIQDESCMCLVHSFCPSPSSHHEFCINENCKKKITHTSYNPYAKSLDSLTLVWKKLVEDYPQLEGLSFNLNLGDFQNMVKIESRSISDPLLLAEQEGRSIQEAYCIATAMAILKIKNEF